jgi:surface antigen
MSRAPAVVAAVLACVSGIAAAQNLRFLGNSPVAYFTDDDMRLFEEAGRLALDTLKTGQSTSWGNPASGASGTIRVARSFEAADGRPCRQLRVRNRARGIEGDARLTLCRSVERGWLFDPDSAQR